MIMKSMTWLVSGGDLEVYFIVTLCLAIKLIPNCLRPLLADCQNDLVTTLRLRPSRVTRNFADLFYDSSPGRQQGTFSQPLDGKTTIFALLDLENWIISNISFYQVLLISSRGMGRDTFSSYQSNPSSTSDFQGFGDDGGFGQSRWIFLYGFMAF